MTGKTPYLTAYKTKSSNPPPHLSPYTPKNDTLSPHFLPIPIYSPHPPIDGVQCESDATIRHLLSKSKPHSSFSFSTTSGKDGSRFFN